MRICRTVDPSATLAFYFDDHIVPVKSAADAYRTATGQNVNLPDDDSLLALLPPDGAGHAAAETLYRWIVSEGAGVTEQLRIATGDAKLRVPVPRPNKLFLLAGNYAKHIEEGGEIAAERAETFPYVFMKPPTTTLTDPGAAIHIPEVSPDAIDWELELAVIIGRKAKRVREDEALEYVAGYTIINDISDRKFRPNANRKPRDRDKFFDWLHGKWHDSFCPCGPCVLSATSVANPQQLELKLRVNDTLHQDSSTAHQIFPVAAVIEFISSFVTLEPGDIISTGTPDGVGNTTGTYLKSGDRIEATIGQIGTLRSVVE